MNRPSVDVALTFWITKENLLSKEIILYFMKETILFLDVSTNRGARNRCILLYVNLAFLTNR
jgi:hypothetical protein